MTKNYRYPGAQPFQRDHKDIFFGREKDIENLHELITLEDLVVLYSKSGLGKSSLLNAGVLPLFEKKPGYRISSIRFGANNEETDATPLSQTKFHLTSPAPPTTLLDKLLPGEDSLWYWLKSWQFARKNNTFLLVFDQFEELFTYPDEEIRSFKEELSELLNTEIPSRFRQFIEKQYEKNSSELSDQELEWIHEPIEVKIVLAIRSDRLSLLNNLSEYLPNILKTCYELTPLNRLQAEEAIINPAFKRSTRFLTPPFDYEDGALDTILDFLTQGGKEKIESFQLQILCQAMERKILEQGLSQITLSEVTQLDQIYENYYDDQIARLQSEEDQRAARQLIEEGLIFEEEERRLNLYEGQIYKTFGFTPELLRQLVDVRLLRAEPSLKGGFTYELCHDTMVGPVLKAKRKRQETERLRAEKAAQLRQQQEMQALQEKADSEQRKRTQARRVAAIAFFFAVLATAASAWAIRSNQEAQQANALIQQQNQELTELNRQQEEQLLALVKADYERLLAEGKQYQSAGDFSQAITSFEEALTVISPYGEGIDAGGLKAKEGIRESNNISADAARFSALMAQGDEAFQQGEAFYRKALQAFQSARNLDLGPASNNRAQNKIDFMGIRINEAFEKHRDRARLFLKEQNPELACQSFRIASRLKPADSFVKEFAGNCQ